MGVIGIFDRIMGSIGFYIGIGVGNENIFVFYSFSIGINVFGIYIGGGVFIGVQGILFGQIGEQCGVGGVIVGGVIGSGNFIYVGYGFGVIIGFDFF